jgi:hypothetical protein
MLAFNQRNSLSPAEEDIFKRQMTPILYAALRGLSFVLVYGHFASHFYIQPVPKIPAMPELEGRRYTYLTTCEGEE